MDNFKRRRLNTEILTKTQIALDAIKRYDMMEQSRINHQFNHQSGKIISSIDHDYTKLNKHKNLKVDHSYKIHMFAYSEQYYCLEMKNYLFPMKVLIKNVKNQGTIFIGYDQEYPGISHQQQNSLFEQPSNQQKNYDHKTAVKRDLFIILKNKGNKVVNNVYFTIQAGKSLFMCDLKIQFLGFTRDERVMSQSKLNPAKNVRQAQTSLLQYSAPMLERQRSKTNPNEELHNMGHSKEFIRSKITLGKIDKPVRLEQFNLLDKVEMVKHQSKSGDLIAMTRQKFFVKGSSKHTLNPNQTIGRDGFGMRTMRSKNKNQKSDLEFKLQQVKKNKQCIQVYKIKQKELKETASKCKKLIENYKKQFNEQTVRKNKLNKDLVIFLYCSQFIRNTFNKTENHLNILTQKIKKDYLCRKFVKKLKGAFAETCSMLPTRHRRVVSQATVGISLLTKMISKHSNQKAERTLIATLDFLQPQLLVRHIMSETNTYRKSIRLIQKVWKTKYHGRMYCLLYFVDNHVEKMMTEFPHFRMFIDNFYGSKANLKISLEYIKDQSEKYRFIYEAYKRKLQEIQQIISVNQGIAKDKVKHKKELIVPKKPTRPMHRFFRNSDILKSMVRTWFQIQYKKYIKKEAKKIKY